MRTSPAPKNTQHVAVFLKQHSCCILQPWYQESRPKHPHRVYWKSRKYCTNSRGPGIPQTSLLLCAASSTPKIQIIWLPASKSTIHRFWILGTWFGKSLYGKERGTTLPLPIEVDDQACQDWSLNPPGDPKNMMQSTTEYQGGSRHSTDTGEGLVGRARYE
jgi:hypothetical protein